MSQLDNTLKREILQSELQLHEIIMEKDIETSHSEVTRYWLPEAFEWFKDTRPQVFVSKTLIRLTEEAVVLAGFDTESIINIGVNKGFIAFRKDTQGLTAKPDSAVQGLCFQGQKVAALLEKNGYSLPCQMVCQWDAMNKMLVAQKPSTKDVAHEKSRGKDHRDPEQVQRKRSSKSRNPE
ncbi:hypothetical protein [Dehalobacter sp. TeCB1]|uniref:hypothetical protein n=1 Tax=Dehalobacter sp. TeCB1 TaxID=1843715 RepID=UPI00083B5343|nr:hypothetical protein [Dehalobacter sp. TeCB1]OCZ53813.1 hypothetical protein A7D23_07580 [Dehalobacter sp. TeCB1]